MLPRPDADEHAAVPRSDRLRILAIISGGEAGHVGVAEKE